MAAEERGSQVPTSPTTPTIYGSAEQAQRFRDRADDVRKRADLTAKALGGLGSTAVAAIGIAKFADLFPVPPHLWWAALLTILGFALIAAVVAYFTFALWHVNEPFVLRSDPEQMTELDEPERELVGSVYREIAHLNWAQSLRALEARAHRLDRISQRLDDATAARLQKEAKGIVDVIRSTEDRALLLVVRRRAAQAIRSGSAVAAYTLFASGVILFGVFADKLDSERSTRIAVAKSCAEARTAHATQLPAICGKSETVNAEQATPAHESARAAEDLGAALARCQAAAEELSVPYPTSCAAIALALGEIASAP